MEGLLAGQTIARAAESAGVGERTVARWLTDPEFRQRLDDARVDQSQRVATRLAGGGDGRGERADASDGR